MSFGTKTNFVIYPEQFWSGVVETLQQNADAFNAASLNCLQLVTRAIKGDYERESFLKSTLGLVTRRDPTSTLTVGDTNLNQDEIIGVKVNRRLGPAVQSRDAFRKMGVDPEEFSMMLGLQMGPSIAIDYINSAIAAAAASISDSGNFSGALMYDNSGQATPTANHSALVSALARFGDRASSVIAWVSHSKPYFDLVKQSLVDKILNVADVTVYSGNVATLGKPTIVIDSSALVTVPGSGATTYLTLGLVEGAVEVAESEERDIISQPITGYDNLFDRIQGEYAFNLKVKGCQYNTTLGANPTAAQVAAAGTWVAKVADQKLMPGVAVKTQ